MKKKDNKNISIDFVRKLSGVLPFLMALCAWAALAIPGKSLLSQIEMRSLFLFEWQPLADSLKVPGGFIGLAGQFLRQFLHLPWLGSLIFVTMLAASGLACIRLFNIPRRLSILGYLPALIMFWALTSIGYMIFIFRFQDYFFAPVLGMLLALGAVALSRKLQSTAASAAMIVILATVGYSLAGYYAVAAIVTVGADIIASERPSRQKYILFAIALGAAVLLPLGISQLYNSVRSDRCWLAGLPSVSEAAKVARVRLPYIAASLITAGLALARRYMDSRESTGKDMAIQATAVLACVAISYLVWFKDPGFVTEMKVEVAAERQDWKSIPKIVKDAEARYGSESQVYEPTRIIVLMKDLALFKQGREGDIAFAYPEGGRPQERDFVLPLVFQAGQQLYLNWGMPNYCHRWSVESSVEYGFNYQTLKNIAMAAMASQEWGTANMYLKKLTHTMFYRNWAKEQLKMCGKPEAVAQAEPYRSILPLMKYSNSMTNDEATFEKFMINHFTSPEPANASPEYDRAALFWTLKLQDIDRFWTAFYHYAMSNNPKTLPKHYQEAIQLYKSLEPNNGMNISVDKNITQSYQAFLSFVQSHPVGELRDSWATYYPKFGNTFYYYYYFIRDIDIY